MREFVLNDACLGGGAPSIAQLAALAIDIENGVIVLIDAGHGLQSMRLAASTGEMVVANGFTLADVITYILRSTSSGRVLARMATKYPIEDDLGEEEFETLVDWSIPAYPASLSLVLCAQSNRIAISISGDPVWMVDPIIAAVQQDPAAPGFTVNVAIDNVYSAANADALSQRLDATFIKVAGPAAIWQDRARLFPALDFAPRVEGDLANLGPIQYAAALGRLKELNEATAKWAAPEAEPSYLSKVTGESEATMNKYGHERRFRSCHGGWQTFENHARLPDGFRLHLRELVDTHRVEIGYIGPHLSVVKKN